MKEISKERKGLQTKERTSNERVVNKKKDFKRKRGPQTKARIQTEERPSNEREGPNGRKDFKRKRGPQTKELSKRRKKLQTEKKPSNEYFRKKSDYKNEILFREEAHFESRVLVGDYENKIFFKKCPA